jgi:uncharacterized membrane protein YbhN (UPF0104 family)
MAGRDPATDEHPDAEPSAGTTAAAPPAVATADRVAVRRRPSDVVRVAVFVVVVAVVVALARIEPDTVTPGLWVIDSVSAGVRRFAGTVLVLSGVAALGVALGLATVRGRRGAVRDVVAAAVASALVSVLVGDLIVTNEVVPAPERAIAALITAALAASRAIAPYLSRRPRRLLLVLAWTAVAAAFAGMWVGPADVVLAAVVGWGVVAAVHLVLGSPRALPPDADVEAAAARHGVDLHGVHPVQQVDWGTVSFAARTADDRPVTVSVYGTDAADAQLLATVWRLLWFKGGRQRLVLSRQHQVEHEALTLLMAARARVAVPDVLAAGLSEDEELSVLVTCPPEGRSLADLDDDALDDDLLTRVWQAVARLHEAGIVHGQLTLTTVVAAEDGGIAFTGFRHATLAGDTAQVLTDRAELLAVLAARVGPERAARTALAGLGADELQAALPVLQPAALSASTRHELHHAKHLLDELRTAAATAAGVDAPELAKLYRLTWGDAAMIVMSMVGIYLIASQIGSVDGLGAALADADLGWAVIALVLSAATASTMAVALTGGIPVPLRVGPVILLELTNQFMGLIGGTIAMTATTIRFAQKRGLGIAMAVSAGVLVSLANFTVQVIVIVASLLLIDDLPARGSGTSNGLPEWLLPTILLALVAIGIAVAVPRLRTRISAKVRPSLESVLQNLRALVRQPRNVIRLALGALGTQLLYALAFECSLLAFGVDLPLLTLLLINTVAALFGGLAPIPGGLGVIEATLVAGLTAFGVDQVTATAGMLTYRTASAYLPPVWGWFSMVWLRRHEYL